MDPRLRAAALKRDLAALDRALDEGADPNAMDADGYTPLIFAVCNNNTDCVAKLIEAGAHPDCYTDKGRTPLNSAASSGYAETIRVLLAGGAQVDFIPPYGYGRLTPLHYAIDFGHAQTIRALLAAGADVNRRTESEFASDRVSPLFRAIKFSRTVANHSILPSLLRAGASINEPGVTELFQLLDETNAFISPTERRVIEYVQAVHTAGSFPAYARGHRSMFAAIFSRGRRLPADVIPKIVEYWAHLGCYQFQVPGTSGTGSKKLNLPVGRPSGHLRLRALAVLRPRAPDVGR